MSSENSSIHMRETFKVWSHGCAALQVVFFLRLILQAEFQGMFYTYFLFFPEFPMGCLLLSVSWGYLYRGDYLVDGESLSSGGLWFSSLELWCCFERPISSSVFSRYRVRQYMTCHFADPLRNCFLFCSHLEQ